MTITLCWFKNLLLLTICIYLLSPLAQADKIKRRADAPKPLSAEKSIKHFRLPKDLRIEIAACEPLLRDPSSIAWDEQGRMFIAEIHGYNLEGHLDVQELNKTGKLDQLVRRIPASRKAKEAAEKETYGTVKMLIDTNGDGRMDKVKVWADRLPPCFGIVPARGGIIAIGRPDIIFLADRDNDGRAEVRKKLFTGFEITILERSINSPRWGLDNWIYVSAGSAGGKIIGPNLKKSVSLGTTDFRFKPDGSAIEPVTGRNHMFGQTMTDWGDRFVTPPGVYAIPIPLRYLSRNPYLPAPSVNANAANYNRLYPASQPHPWRMERSQKKDWNKYYTDRYGKGESAPNGYFTSSCGQMIYRANILPKHYHGNQFCCDPAQNLVHRNLLKRNGLRFTAQRAPEEQKSEFLTSTDQWFRPLNIATGPDGAMYIVDMYREIIEDYSAIPRYLQQQYGLIEGRSHGRIWRVFPKNVTLERNANLSMLSTAKLVSRLSNPNAWWRHTAQRLLVERGDHSAVKLLENLARQGKTPQARLHALYTLQGLQALQPTLIEHLINDSHFALRIHALRLSEPWLDKNTPLLKAVLKRVNNPDPKVRLQLALTVGQSKNAQVLTVLAQLAEKDGDDPWVRAAILSSVTHSADRLIATILKRSSESSRDNNKSDSLLQPLAAIIGARHNDDEIANLLVTITTHKTKNLVALQVACLKGLLEGLQRGKSHELKSKSGKKSLQLLIVSDAAEVRSLTLKVAGVTKFTNSAEMKAIFGKAAKDVLNAKLPVKRRQAAMDILSSAPSVELLGTVKKLLNPRQPSSLQLSAIAAITPIDNPQVTSVLLNNWTGSTPAIRQAILDAIFTRVSRLPQLLDAIEKRTVSPHSLSTLQRTHLLENSNKHLRNRARKLIIKKVSLQSRKLLEQYRTALSKPRDAARGELLFKKNCANCHRVNNSKQLLGPDLSVVQTRSDETILLDILQPSAKISAGYRSYLIIDTSGKVYTGILTSETATSVKLRSLSPKGTTTSIVEQTILRKDIDEMKSTEHSLMPDDIQKLLSPQDTANVIAYLRKLLGPQVPSVLTLFDDNLSFIKALKNGSGTATPETKDIFSGKSALRVTPLQRHSPNIPGWKYRIREKPGPGEFRYLRLAWKMKNGDGIMIELADNGQWPKANQSIRRYYSGKNTSNWKATKVSDRVPNDWVVITRDLWKDFGNFTLTGIAPTAMGGHALFDKIELIRSLDDLK